MKCSVSTAQVDTSLIVIFYSSLDLTIETKKKVFPNTFLTFTELGGLNKCYVYIYVKKIANISAFEFLDPNANTNSFKKVSSRKK